MGMELLVLLWGSDRAVLPGDGRRFGRLFRKGTALPPSPQLDLWGGLLPDTGAALYKKQIKARKIEEVFDWILFILPARLL